MFLKRTLIYWSMASLLLFAVSSISAEPRIVARDGQFVKFSNGIVYDKKTGVEWLAGPDKDMNWNEAKSWVAGLDFDGGGWRMPSVKALKSLYKKGAGSLNITPLLCKKRWIWSMTTKSNIAAYFDFSNGIFAWHNVSISHDYRALAFRKK